MDKDQIVVRLKPYDPQNGCKLQRYMHRSHLFVNMDGSKPVERWFPVDEKIAEELRAIRQETRPDGSPRMNTPLAFDVCTVEEAKALKRAEKRAAMIKLTGEAQESEEDEIAPDPDRATPMKLREVSITDKPDRVARPATRPTKAARPAARSRARAPVAV